MYPVIINKIQDKRDNHFSTYKQVTGTSYACATLGKIGYKLQLTKETLDLEREDDTSIIPTVNYWLDKVFPNTRDENGEVKSWDTDWCYEIRMNNTPESIAFALSYQRVNTQINYDKDDSFLEIIPSTTLSGQPSYDLTLNTYDNGTASIAVQNDIRRSDIIYDEPYVSQWEDKDGVLTPVKVTGTQEKARIINCENSNKYNITQDIAEAFEVYCYYEYKTDSSGKFLKTWTDENGKIWTGKKVVYYNNAIDIENPLQLNYQYNLQTITREADSENLYTKMYVTPIASETMTNGYVTIADATANPNMDDFILNFDYLDKIHGLTELQKDEIPAYEYNLRQINREIFNINNTLLSVSADLEDIKAKAAGTDKERTSAADTYEKYEYQIINGVYGDQAHMQQEQGRYLVWVPDQEGAAHGSVKIFEGLEATTLIGFYKNSRDDNAPNFGYYNKQYFLFTASPIDDEHPANLVQSSGNIIEDISDTSKYYYVLDDYGYVIDIYTNLQNVSANDRGIAYLAFTYTPNNKYAAVAATYKQEMERAQDAYEQYIAKQEEIQKRYDELEEQLNNKLAEKEQLNKRFSAIMGPALREGYYQPDEYDDAVQSYTIPITSTTSGDQSGEFIWDNELFDGEDRPYYESDQVERVYNYYVNLTDIYGDITDPNEVALRFYPGPVTVTLGDGASLVPNNYSISWKNSIGIYYGSLDYELPGGSKLTLNMEDALKPFIKCVFKAEKILANYRDYLTNNGVSESCLNDRFSIKYNMNNNQLYQAIKLIEYGVPSSVVDQLLETDKKNQEVVRECRNIINDILQEKSTYITRDELLGRFNSENYDDDENYPFEKSVLAEYLGKYDENSNAKHLKRPIVSAAEMQEAGYDIEEGAQCTSYTSMFIFGDRATIGDMVDFQYGKNLIVHYTPILNKYSSEDETIILSDTQARQYFEKLLALDEDLMYADAHGVKIEIGGAEKDISNIIYRIAECGDTAYSISNDIVVEEQNFDIPWHILEETYYLSDDDKFLSFIQEQEEEHEEQEEADEDLEERTTYIYLSLKKPAQDLIPVLGLFSNIYEYSAYAGAGFWYGFAKDNNNSVFPMAVLNDFYKNDPDNPISNYNIKKYTIGKTDYSEPINTAQQFNDSLTYVVPRIKITKDNVMYNTETFQINKNELGDSLTKFVDYRILLRQLVPHVTLKVTLNNSIGQILNGSYILKYDCSNANEMLYLDAIKVAKENSQPKYSYTIEVANLPEYRDEYKLGQLVTINDYQLGVYNANGYINAIEFDLDSPSKDKLTIENYKTKFEDLFGSISATNEAVKTNMPTFSAVASSFTSGGLGIRSEALQDALSKASYALEFLNSNMTIDTNGILVTNFTPYADGNYGKVLLSGGGLFVAKESDSNGNPIWLNAITPEGVNANQITSGTIDTNNIRIMANGTPAFQWNPDGIFAYKKKDGVYDTDTYVRYNQDGLLFNDKGFEAVKLGWDGLSIKAQNGAVSLTATNGLEVFDGNNQLIQLGKRSADEYGLFIKDRNNNDTLVAKGDGTLWLKQKLSVGEGQNAIEIEHNNGSSSIGTAAFASGPMGTGWRVDGEGNATFNNINARGKLSAVVFEYQTVSSVGGNLYIAPTILIDGEIDNINSSQNGGLENE